MLSSWLVYLIVRLDMICSLAIVGDILFGVSLAGLLFVALLYYIDNKNFDIFKKPIKGIAIGFIICTVLTVFVPSTKEAAIIYMLPKIANNEQVQKIPDNFGKLLNAKMEQWINETVVKRDDAATEKK